MNVHQTQSAGPTAARVARCSDDHSIRTILERVRTAGSGPDVHVHDIVEALGPASFGPLILVPAMLVFSPLSGIPGMSTVCGLSIALIAVQWPLGRRHVWLPGWIKRRQLKRDRLSRAIDASSKPLAFLDRITRHRLRWLVFPPVSIVNEAVCLLCGLMMPFLELVPLSSSILGLAVTLMAVSSITRDGVLAALGYGVIAFGACGIVVLMHVI